MEKPSLKGYQRLRRIEDAPPFVEIFLDLWGQRGIPEALLRGIDIRRLRDVGLDVGTGAGPSPIHGAVANPIPHVIVLAHELQRCELDAHIGAGSDT